MTCSAAGLMLMWACDLIVGVDDVGSPTSSAPGSGMCGVEYFAHPWEFGPRKTKELMLTGDSIDVHEAHRLGMVQQGVPRDELADRTLEFARRIAQLPTMTALLIKESVNQTVDNMGFYNSLQACFTLHQLNHSHWAGVREDKRAPPARTKASPIGVTRRPSSWRSRTRCGPTDDRHFLRRNAGAAPDGRDTRTSFCSAAVLRCRRHGRNRNRRPAQSI